MRQKRGKIKSQNHVTFRKAHACMVQKGDVDVMRKHDLTALQIAYETYADLLYRVALSHLRHHDDALDAVQDVFLKLHTSDKRFRDREHERAWLLRVTINRCHDLARRQHIRAYTSLDDVTEIAAEEHERPAVFDEIDRLPEALKSAVVLHYLEGFSVDETALILKLSPSAVKMRLSRARDTLRSALQGE